MELLKNIKIKFPYYVHLAYSTLKVINSRGCVRTLFKTTVRFLKSCVRKENKERKNQLKIKVVSAEIKKCVKNLKNFKKLVKSSEDSESIKMVKKFPAKRYLVSTPVNLSDENSSEAESRLRNAFQYGAANQHQSRSRRPISAISPAGNLCA